jgi:hypothetical protein
MTVQTEILEDPDLDRLVAEGDIESYGYAEIRGHGREADYHSIVLHFKSGNKLAIHSWSTPAPESSGLSCEYIDRSVKLS